MLFSTGCQENNMTEAQHSESHTGNATQATQYDVLNTFDLTHTAQCEGPESNQVTEVIDKPTSVQYGTCVHVDVVSKSSTIATGCAFAQACWLSCPLSAGCW